MAASCCVHDSDVMSYKTLIVVPTYQESANIDELLRRVRHAAPDVDVLVVDDRSPDGTADLAGAVASELGQIAVLRRDEKNGLGAAYRAGFAWGLERGYDVLVEMDADLSHDPCVIPSLLREIRAGADLAIGSRYVPGGATPHWSAPRRLLSRAGNRYAHRMLALPVTDATSGYRAYRASTLDAVEVDKTHATGYGFQIELAYRVSRYGASIAEVPIVFNDRTRGTSKMTARIAIEALALVTWWSVRDRVLGWRRVVPAEHATPVTESTTGVRAAA
jgi:dolichol-phosphate mannosyltransferase